MKQDGGDDGSGPEPIPLNSKLFGASFVSIDNIMSFIV